MLTLIPHTTSHASDAPSLAHAFCRSRAEGPGASTAPGSRSPLVALALEPTGDAAYADAVREWIDRVSPRDRPRPVLHLVR